VGAAAEGSVQCTPARYLSLIFVIPHGVASRCSQNTGYLLQVTWMCTAQTVSSFITFPAIAFLVFSPLTASTERINFDSAAKDNQTEEALAYVDTGRAKGKVVVRVRS
jgi:hypothetical protein